MTITRDERWQEHFDALHQYTNRTGNALVPTTHVEIYNGKNIALGAWVAYNRQRQRAGTLPVERVNALGGLSGWKWEKQQPGRRYDKSRDEVIIKAYTNGTSAKDLAKQYGLSRQRVHQIVRNKA
jgi:Mor family transcriptional regulator